MSDIEHIFAHAAALGKTFVELQLRKRDCGDAEHAWTAYLIVPGSGSGIVADCTAHNPEAALAEMRRVLAARLQKRLAEAESEAKALRAALNGGHDGP